MKKQGNTTGENSASSGRTIIIVVLVLTSAFSFILGYFVGKATVKERLKSEFMSLPKQQEYDEPIVQAQPPKEQDTTPTTDSIFNQLEETKDFKKEVKETSEDNRKAATLETAVKKETAQPPVKMTKPIEDTDIYTVQVGAFKNQKDADSLKRKLEDKKYKAYIKKTTLSQGVKLFKVRTGEFAKREDAEALAIKLKKIEGLNTFVTLKNEDANKGEKSPAAKKEASR